MSKELFHWYVLTFSYTADQDRKGDAWTYMGWTDRLLTIPRIENAKKDALSQIDSETVKGTLISAIYLGYMTEDQVKTHV